MVEGGQNLNSSNLQLLSDRFNVPLFLLTRQHLRSERPEVLKNYLNKKCPTYVTSCNTVEETATKKYIKHIVGLKEPTFKEKCKVLRFPHTPKCKTNTNSWFLPPNHYQIEEEKNKPCYGALWKKLTKHTVLPFNNTPPPKLYNLPSFTDKLQSSCNKHKGVFLTNARTRRATTRSMITNTATCFRDPNEPGPTTYVPRQKIYTCAPSSKTPDPDIYYPSTTVPIRNLSIQQKYNSFAPAPGRYENRFQDFCGCSPKLTYWPNMQFEIDKQKRKKFRLQPFTKIKVKSYYTLEWRHVKGNGFQRLFKTSGQQTPSKHLPKSLKQKKTYKRVQMHPDARYFKMINNPTRLMESTFRSPIRGIQKPMRFNCIVKRLPHKQLRNKKIAFGSCTDRFEDIERASYTITTSQLETLKNSLPPERQFRDYPVMRISPNDIVSNLFKVPAHRKPTTTKIEAKRQFKFANLPEPKILVTDNDTHVVASTGDIIECKGLFSEEIDPRNFFREDIEEEVLRQYELCLKT